MAEETRPPRVDMRETNKGVIANYRATGGKPAEGQFPLVLLTTKGAKTGKEHTTPVCVREYEGKLVVAGSMGGRPTHPQWYKNIVAADGELTVEYLGDTYRAKATVVPNSLERNVLFDMMSEVIVGLYGYQDKCRDQRQIPVLLLERA